MDEGTYQSKEHWGLASPFALIVADGAAMGDDEHLAASYRRMGLRPKVESDGTTLTLHFGSMAFQAKRAEPPTMAGADPACPETSVISHSLPTNWKSGGACLVFTPLTNGVNQAPGSARANALREFFKAMVLLIDLFDASHLYWSPARQWSDARQFRDAVAEMLVSGMPPILHLVAFQGEAIGPDMLVRTRGLANFSGQELVSLCPGDWSMAHITKRLARVALDMVLNGTITHARRYRGLEPGEWMQLTPEPGTRDRAAVVRVAFQLGND